MRNKLNTLEEFRALQTKCIAAQKAETRKVLVCCGTGCMAGGNLALYEELKKEMAAHGLPYELSTTPAAAPSA